MDNFDLKKYLAEGRLLKEQPYITLTPEQIEDFTKRLKSLDTRPFHAMNMSMAELVKVLSNDEYDNEYGARKLGYDYFKFEKFANNLAYDILNNKSSQSSTPISLSPEQKEDFEERMLDISNDEDREYAMGEAGNVLARILTNGEAEFIEDVEEFDYDSLEVEEFAQNLASEIL